MKYFAYGSNMLSERLKKRVPGAEILGMASLQKHSLRFHKKSSDGSAKCDLFNTGIETDKIYGVLFEVPDSQLLELDDAEGCGKGYKRNTLKVTDADNAEVSAMAYVATADAIVADLLPYDWYRELVLCGARQNDLPADYIKSIEAVGVVTDPMLTRTTRKTALEALAAAAAKPTNEVQG
jgi:gamma-glutamylcyclotransferase (GGCT)/AIG2-like uncharacterized protein YtfP